MPHSCTERSGMSNILPTKPIVAHIRVPRPRAEASRPESAYRCSGRECICRETPHRQAVVVVDWDDNADERRFGGRQSHRPRCLGFKPNALQKRGAGGFLVRPRRTPEAVAKVIPKPPTQGLVRNPARQPPCQANDGNLRHEDTPQQLP